MKRIAVTWEETAVYEAVIEVPDDYPESVEAYDDVEALLSGQVGEGDWWDRVEAQVPDWPTKNLMSVHDRELTHIERVKEQVA